jgi:polyisoprenoid-binding protein YceI
MKTFRRILTIGLIAWGAASSASLQAAPRLTAMPESRLWLSGTSTLHPYESTSTQTQIFAELKAPASLVEIAQHAPFQRFEVLVPVQGLKSHEAKLDKNMYKALKSEQAPEIRFQLTHYDAQGAGDAWPFKAQGSLSIAGVQRPVELQGTAQIHSTELVMQGAYELRMSDYGVKPRTLMFGAIKVGDPVVIHFHLVFTIVEK